jgi:hypothetical protein
MLIYDRLRGKYVGTQYSAIVAPFEKAIRAAQILDKDEIEDEELAKATEYVLEALSLSVIPIPMTGLKRARRSLDLWMGSESEEGDGVKAAKNMIEIPIK